MMKEQMHRLFERQAEERREQAAVISGDEQLSYEELNRRADLVALRLSESGLRGGDVVAVAAADSTAAIAAVLGVLKAGGVLLPLDPEAPAAFVAPALEDSGATHLLKSGGDSVSASFAGKTLELDSAFDDAAPGSVEPAAPAQESPLAAVVYQSDHSGRPVGVALSHESLAGWADFNLRTLENDFTHTLFVGEAGTALGFPLWLAAFAQGGTVYLHRQQTGGDFTDLRAFTAGRDFTNAVFPLRVLGRLGGEDYAEIFRPGLKSIVSAGEGLIKTSELKAYLKANSVRWYNYYGFPQTQIVTTLQEESAGEATEPRHVGRPVAETRAFILNEEHLPVPVGVVGDLYLSGSGHVEAFHNSPGLNQQRFAESPFEAGAKLFRTGHKASWLPNKLVAIHADAARPSVKGEVFVLAEAEAALNLHEVVEECAVVAGQDGEGDARVKAYLVLNNPLAAGELEEHLRRHLPARVFPIGFVTVSALPRKAGGEIDRDRLRELDLLDTVDAARIEARLTQEPEVEEAAVLISERVEKRPATHLSKLLPHSSRQKLGVGNGNGNGHRNGNGNGNGALHLKAEQQLTGSAGDRPLAISHGASLEEEAGGPRNLRQTLERAAASSPQRGVIFDSPDAQRRLPYAELLTLARRQAARLRAAGVNVGDRVILQAEQAEPFLVGFWGCVLAGAVAVPLSVPGSYEAGGVAGQVLGKVWEVLGEPAVLAGEEEAAGVRRLLGERARVVEVVSGEVGSEEAVPESEADWHDAAADEEVALLLFTSGSTGQPKGVMLSHRNLLARSRGTAHLNSFTSEDVSLNWMPLTHVGGLVMFHLRDVYVGCEQVQARTADVLADPLRWLDLIERHSATVTWAPNFAYGLINAESERMAGRRWDLSRMRFILNGGEAVNAQTGRKFLRLLGEHGLRPTAIHPAYGMSETSSGITYSDSFSAEEGTGSHTIKPPAFGRLIEQSGGADAITFVEVGEPIPGVSIRIVDHEGRPVSEDLIGRVQAKGLPVMSGYFENPELNAQVFSDGWLNTGDLGFLCDGRLTITGREKDVIIINGINYYSHEIEAVVEEVGGLDPSYTAACTIRNGRGDTDGLAIFFSPGTAELSHQARQVGEIRHRITQKIGVTPDFVIPVGKDEIPKTSIGKIQRTKLSEQFAAGHFDSVLERMDVALSNERTLPSWFFKKSWRREALPETVAPEAARTRLVFADGLGLGAALAAKFEEDGSRCVLVEDGQKFARDDADRYVANFGDAGHYRQLLEALGEEGVEPDDILYLADYTAYAPLRHGDLEVRDLKKAQEKSFFGLLHLTQALAARPQKSARLYVVTSHAQMVKEGEPLAYEKTAVSGLLKSLPLEMPWLKCGHLDLEADGAAADTAAAVYAELRGAKVAAAEVAYRQGQRWASFLSEVDLGERGDGEIPIKHGGIYLLTGGLGGVGVEVAKWLIKEYSARLILIGRTALPERSEWASHADKETILGQRVRNYMALEALGGELIYEDGDVSDHSFVNDVVSRAESDWEWGEPLSGIFHLAGTLTNEGRPDQSHWDVMDEQEAAVITRDAVESQLRAKVYGAVALSQLLDEKPDALLVAFSSVNSFFGGTTLSAYSAANSFLEGFCLHRRYAKGNPAYCLGWSMWDDTGIARDIPTSIRAASRSAGFEAIGVAQGVYSLAAALSGPHPQLYVGLDGGNRNVRRFLKGTPSERQVVKVYYSPKEGLEPADARLQNVVLGAVAESGRGHGAAVTITRAESVARGAGRVLGQEDPEGFDGALAAAVEAGLPTNDTERDLVRIWQEVLGRGGFGVNDDFFALGGHSLLATKLLARIANAFGVDVPLRVLFESPTVKELAARIERVRRPHRRGEQARLRPIARDGELPLSFAQQRLWFLDQMEPGNSFYNMPVALRLSGALDVAALEKSLAEIVRRHESLRTVFPKVEGKPTQVISETAQTVLAVNDLGGIAEREREHEALRLAREEARRPFDLGSGPLFRAGLLRLADADHILTLTMHHIISDGWSVGIFVRELVTFYQAYAAGDEPQPAPLPIQYADFAAWQREWLQGDVLEKQLAYWKPQLAGRLPVLQLPTDRPRPLVQSFRGASRVFEMPAELTGELNALSRQEGVTLFMTLLAGFKTLLYQYSRQEDIIVGTPIANRRQQEVEELIGFFVNSLVLRTHFADNPTFRDLLGRVREVALGAFAHQDMPFEHLVETLRPERDLSHSPLFQVMFVLQNTPREVLNLAGLTISPLDLNWDSSKFDMTLSMEEADGRLVGVLEYNTDLFDDSTISRMLGHFTSLLTEFAADPGRRVASLPADEQAHLVRDWNETRAERPHGRCVHQLFEEHAAARPEALAVAAGDVSWTYGELNARANRLAHRLRAMGVGPEVSVAVCVERAPEMLVAYLGALKAGGNFVSLDHRHPKERLAFMLKDSGARLLLTQERLREVLPEHELPVIKLDADWETLSGESESNPEAGAGEENIAYVIYTSGSTGQPKGVEVTHAALVNLVAWHNEAYGVTASDRASQVATLGFDASVWEVWPYLSAGASLHLPGDETITMLSKFLPWLKEQRITLCFLPTPLAEVTLEETLPDGLALRALLVGGDKLHQAPQKALPFRLVNHYGPTENAVVTTCAEVETGPDAAQTPPPIGRPISNTRVYLLDEYMEAVPVGVAGELYIGGESLARGYRQRASLTAERFVPDPFSGEPGARLYRTGDVARYLSDGQIEFIGRQDHQVKLRGYRIELGEIESVLKQHEAIGEAVVLARGEALEKALVAYLVATSSPAPAAGELREYLKGRLPDYMVPASFVMLSSMPLTPNGKIDLRALPRPDEAAPAEGATFVEPRTESERKIAAVWQEMLQIEKVGIHDNFFEIGGHSLLMVQVQSKLQEMFGRELTTIELFQYPTIHTLAAFLDEAPSEAPAVEESQNRAEVRRASMEARRQSRQRAESPQAGLDHEAAEGEGPAD